MRGHQADMDARSAFMTAFWAGLAAPAGMYGPTPYYMAYALPQDVAQAFLLVGAELKAAAVMAEANEPRVRPESV